MKGSSFSFGLLALFSLPICKSSWAISSMLKRFNYFDLAPYSFLGWSFSRKNFMMPQISCAHTPRKWLGAAATSNTSSWECCSCAIWIQSPLLSPAPELFFNCRQNHSSDYGGCQGKPLVSKLKWINSRASWGIPPCLPSLLHCFIFLSQRLCFHSGLFSTFSRLLMRGWNLESQLRHFRDRRGRKRNRGRGGGRKEQGREEGRGGKTEQWLRAEEGGIFVSPFLGYHSRWFYYSPWFCVLVEMKLASSVEKKAAKSIS